MLCSECRIRTYLKHIKFLLSFNILEDPKLSTILLVFPLVFIVFVFTRLHKDDGIVVVVVVVLAIFSDRHLLVICFPCDNFKLLVRSFICFCYGLARKRWSSWRFRKKIDTRKRRFKVLLSDLDRMKEFLKFCAINFVCP